MILKFAIQTVFEIAVVVLIVYGFVKEDKLIAFEDRVRAKIRAQRSGHNAVIGKDRGRAGERAKVAQEKGL